MPISDATWKILQTRLPDVPLVTSDRLPHDVSAYTDGHAIYLNIFHSPDQVRVQLTEIIERLCQAWHPALDERPAPVGTVTVTTTRSFGRSHLRLVYGEVP